MPFSKSGLHGEENPLSAGGLKKDLAITGFDGAGFIPFHRFRTGGGMKKAGFFYPIL